MQESLSGRPVFIDVLSHQEITVCIFCEFPGSGSWVVRVVAPWGKWNTTIWSLLIRKTTTLYYHVLSYLYIYMYVNHCVVSSCCFVVAVAETVVPQKACYCFWRNPRCSLSACRSQATITWHRSPKRRRCHEKPRNLMGRSAKTVHPNYFTERMKGDVKAAKLNGTLVASQTPVTNMSSFACMFACIARAVLRKPALLSHFDPFWIDVCCLPLQVTHMNLQSYPTNSINFLYIFTLY